jgi:alpha-L-fucosidase 2
MHRDEFRTRAHPWSVDQSTVAENRFETQEIMQLDGTMAFATAIYEMLVQVRRGVVHIFPAVPAAWRDVSFSDIRVPGPFQVSACRRNGVLQEIKVRALCEGCLVLALDGDIQMQIMKREALAPAVRDDRGAITLEMREGEEAEIRPMPFAIPTN